MTKRYPGGYITKTAPTVTTSSAPGIWTMEQQAAYQKAGTWPAQPNPQYIEDVFSTWLYTGTGATQSISNGINLSANGGMVWIKDRTNAYNNNLFDTAQGATKLLHSNTTDVTVTDANSLTAFNTTGFTLGSGNTSGNQVNTSTDNFVSWTFRKQAKFFDIVTYTGNDVDGRTVAHSLGSTPGFVIVKNITNAGFNWMCWATDPGRALALNSTAAGVSGGSGIALDGYPNIVAGNTTTFRLFAGASSINAVNTSGNTYVAYLFAHNAGGFGLTGTDNVISCGSFTTDGSGNASVTLGYEPQWVLYKPSSTAANWTIIDTMRGFANSTNATVGLYPNLSNAEGNISAVGPLTPTATGFSSTGDLYASATYIYIAIRRGPMKTPTDATKVFEPVTYQGNSSTQSVSIGFPTDLFMGSSRTRTVSPYYYQLVDRLRGYTAYLATDTTFSEGDFGSVTNAVTGFDNQSSMPLGANNKWNYDGGGVSADAAYITYALRRAPGFFDEVCYTGTGTTQTVTHNLGVAPELMIFKTRNNGSDWMTYAAPLGATKRLLLNGTNAAATDSFPFANTAPTSTVFTVGTSSDTNPSGYNQVAYLFATVAGVSKVGSYTGTGGTQTIDCGFTGGARFVLIKRTDSTGAWYVYDTARGMTSSTDPYLLMNSTAAETTGTDYVETSSTGFTITSTAPAAINANGGTFIFLAIA